MPNNVTHAPVHTEVDSEMLQRLERTESELAEPLDARDAASVQAMLGYGKQPNLTVAKIGLKEYIFRPFTLVTSVQARKIMAEIPTVAHSAAMIIGESIARTGRLDGDAAYAFIKEQSPELISDEDGDKSRELMAVSIMAVQSLTEETLDAILRLISFSLSRSGNPPTVEYLSEHLDQKQLFYCFGCVYAVNEVLRKGFFA